MAIATFAAYEQRLRSLRERRPFTKAAPATGVIARAFALWAGAGLPGVGAAPTTAVVPTSSTTGALGQANGTSGLSIIQLIASWATPLGGTLVVADRLSHQGGLSGTVAGAQTTNLPTAALTRRTGGLHVLPTMEIYTVIGTTATTVTASYTNRSSVAGNATPTIAVGGTGLREAGQVLWLPLLPGDDGCLSVESITLAASTTTVGNFGVTLRYPLLTVPANRFRSELFERGGQDALFGFGHFPGLESGACVELIQHTNSATPGVLVGELRFAEV